MGISTSPSPTTSSQSRAGPVPGSAVNRSDRKSTRLNSSHSQISYAVFCLKKKKKYIEITDGGLGYFLCNTQRTLFMPSDYCYLSIDMCACHLVDLDLARSKLLGRRQCYLI